MKRYAGFSLIETLAALALLALLLLGVMASLDTIARTTRTSLAATQRLDEVRAAQNYLRTALSGALAYPWALDADKRPLVFSGDVHSAIFVSPGPGYLASEGLQLQKLSIVGKPGDQRLEVAFAPMATRQSAQVVPSAPETLVDHLASGRFTYSGVDDQGQQVTWSTTWPYRRRMPTAIGVELQLRGGVRWPTFTVPLRMDPVATNVREALARLMAPEKPP
ncbi:prepilin-type N-terminal cleavage/methylation domain-containing protein [Luteibacter sp. CQ10]|uniref:prepilin-type N-terminal cleavage/methylation domain-containing protein n=1 Tax=Luteibacter sp. CQ10 TaxID=2805821 RepID=UPI0034A34EB3